MSVSQPDTGAAVLPDFSSMTEEEQIAYAMQMSLAGGGEPQPHTHCALITDQQSVPLYTLIYLSNHL